MGKIKINNRDYGQVILGNQVTLPENGIVPTSWAPNGFVLSINNYGDIMPGALCSSDIYDIYARDPNIPSNIDIHELDLGSGSNGQQIFNFLHNMNFIEPVSYIGEEAFKNQYRMICNSLPNGLTYIGYNAFESCYNTKINTIPSTVSSIGDYAFTNSNKPEELVSDYDSTATYNIGDTAYYDNRVYTCIIAISVAEEFNSNHWVEGYYPEILGIYNSSNTYQNGDIVYDSDQSQVCTCCYRDAPQVIAKGNAPSILGMWDASTTYHPGDAVAYYNSGSNNYDICTCIETCTNQDPSNGTGYSSPWIGGYYPELIGGYDSSRTYSIGDIIVNKNGYVYSCYTCCVDITTAEEFDQSHWVYGYCPTLLGMYDSNVTYHMGDVIVCNNNICTCVVANSSSPDEFSNEFGSGAYPNIEEYSSDRAYSVGDIVFETLDQDNIICATCYRNAPAGTSTSDTDYWADGYYKNISGIYDTSSTYSVGTVLYYPDDWPYVVTVARVASPIIELLSGYTPDLIEEYDPSHTYHTGDVVAYDSGSLNKYVCISPNSVTGEWNSSYWSEIYDFVLNSIRFLGTPETVGNNIFNDSGYNFILVPWENGEGPEIATDYNQYIIYGFVGE